ncbi:MAG: D-xylose ABC transporter ATP-binding protein, partial [Thermoprotei archaeon]
VSFYVRSGEILGIFGLVGSGRTTMAQMIVGARPKKSGEVYVDGKKVIIKKPSDAIKAGIAYLPEDRRYQGLVLRMNVRDNITLPILKRIRSLSMGLLSPINRVKEEGIVSDHIGKLRIVPPDPNRKTMYLSGGNQQKVVLAKWLASRARVLILDEPTRGIDVGAKVEIRKLMVELAREGKAVILISSELMEVLGMSDRILVMADGKIVAEFERAEATPQKVMECAVKSYR